MTTPNYPRLNGKLGRPLRGALLGGGLTKDGNLSFIAQHHRDAVEFGHRGRIVAGAFSDDSPDWSRGMAEFYQIDPDRAYRSAAELIETEGKKSGDERVDFVDIATPNCAHFAAAKAAILAGFNVICEKPLTMTVDESVELAELARSHGVVFAIPHGYGFWPCSTLAGEIIASGQLGKVLAVRVVYIQGWLATKLEGGDCAQANWRTDPKQTGAGGSTGDISSHGFDMARRVAGVVPLELMAQLRRYVQGRPVDDYSHAVIRCENGVLVTVTSSQISVGRRNDIQFEVDCTEGSLAWKGELPNELHVHRLDKREEVYTDDPNAAWAGDYPKFKAACHWPGGHPEGLDRAWQNLFGAAFDDMALRALDESFDGENTFYPNVDDGVWGMRFITAAVDSDQKEGIWVPLTA